MPRKIKVWETDDDRIYDNEEDAVIHETYKHAQNELLALFGKEEFYDIVSIMDMCDKAPELIEILQKYNPAYDAWKKVHSKRKSKR